MNTNERFHAVMNFKPFDRLPLLEWAGWWNKTIARWHEEGLPRELTDGHEIRRHFGLDSYRQKWLGITKPSCPSAPGEGQGIIADAADYERILPHLYMDDPVDTRMWEAWAAEQQAGESVLWFTIAGFFWFPRDLFGIEDHLMAFYDHPELMHRINSDLADYMIRTIEQLCSVCTPDFMTFAEDMSYNHGSMISEDVFNEFLRPYYERVIPVLRKHGIIPIIDSDGDITEPAKWFAAAGLDGILPLERQAGVDIGLLRRNNPELRVIGHFDKLTMHRGEAVMRAEFERLLPTAAQGGYLISCDHQTPPGVSYEDYKTYISLFREYAEEAGARSRLRKEGRS